uniref:Ribbon-helix-helix protein, CopG family n=1 Tax=Thermofilum pendens TaxID=2269 RepID=A0A7C4FB94_THEPE
MTGVRRLSVCGAKALLLVGKFITTCHRCNGVGVKKISVSIPEELLEVLNEVAREEGVPRSKIIVEALTGYLRRRAPVKAREYPTVLWKLEVSGRVRLRSPKRVGRRLGCGWVVEEF